jgi:hypothetical protein
LSSIFLAKMGERLSRTSIKETPRFIGIDQKDALELRTAPAVDKITTARLLRADR